MNKFYLFLVTVSLFAYGCVAFSPQPAALVSFTSATPPKQPVNGPGGKDYLTSGFTMDHFGTDVNECWMWVPNAVPVDGLPIVVFMHGWNGMSPDMYDGWIKQFVNKGSVVIFPRYQTSSSTPLNTMTASSKLAIVTALQRLKDKNIKTTSNAIFVGHSIGGFIAANLAAANDPTFPKASGLFLANACDGVLNGSVRLSLPIADLSKIPTDCIVLATISDQDGLATPENAVLALSQMRQIPNSLKTYVLIHSDSHGSPVITADHAGPTSAVKLSSKSYNCIDWYCYWKFGDALVDAVYRNKNRDYILGGGHNEIFMGKWSDGVEYLPLSLNPLP